MRPFAGDLDGGVRRVGDHVVGLPRGSFAFALDAHQRFDEAIHLGLGFRFGRLDHQRLMHGERERRGMEPVVHQAVGDVAAVDVVVLLERGQVEDHLVSHAAGLARIIGAVFRCQRRGHVVGIDDRHFGGAAQPVSTQHLDITVGYGQQHGGAPGGRRHGRDALVAARRHNRMRGEECPEVLGDADRAYARAAAAVAKVLWRLRWQTSAPM